MHVHGINRENIRENSNLIMLRTNKQINKGIGTQKHKKGTKQRHII